MNELAQEVIEAPSAVDATENTSRASRDNPNNWNNIKICVMRENLYANVVWCEEFKSVFLGTARKRLEYAVTGDDFWRILSILY